ncbi:MAG: purine-nucleoside phosphorylase [Myxococcales bacterium]|jgi:purine-nucleoside phosphorylase
MSLHLDAAPGSYAPALLLPGDPKRARRIADALLQGAKCVNERRAAYGFTGTYGGKQVSIQSTGMGNPSMAIYATELVVDYGARFLLRIGTCGALRPELKVGDLVLATAASTDSGMNRRTFGGADFAPAADFGLLRLTWDKAQARGLEVRVGPVLTSDDFYAPAESARVWADHGVLAVEMETNALYTVAARHGVAALSILTVSDVVGGTAIMDPDDRERSLMPMAELALEVAAAVQAY